MEYDGINDSNAASISDGVCYTKPPKFLLLYQYNIGGILSGHGVCTCMKEREVHLIGAGDCIKKHRAAKSCADGLPYSGYTGLLYEHSTLLYSYILSLGVKSKGLPLKVK
jgi:hypothetical protein